MLVLLQKSNFDYFYLDCRNVLGVDHDARRDLPRRPGADIPPFDPARPFSATDSDVPGFDPNKPFDVVEAGGSPKKADSSGWAAAGRGAYQGATFGFGDELRGLSEAGGTKPEELGDPISMAKGAYRYWSGDKEQLLFMMIKK
jgi:hypothetical protein